MAQPASTATPSLTAAPTFSLAPIDVTDVPRPGTEDYAAFLNRYFDTAQSIVDSVPNWKKRKVYGGLVQTYDRGSDGKEGKFGWHARESRHDSGQDGVTDYDKFRQGLMVKHTEREKAYIESLTEIECLEKVEEGVAEIWLLSYTFPRPVSPRNFVQLILTRETSPTPERQRAFLIVSVPIHHPSADKPKRRRQIKGAYASVEEVREVTTEDGRKGVQWRMATISKPAGRIPAFLSERSIDSKISEDVPSFLDYLRSKPFPESNPVPVVSNAGAAT